MRIPIATLLVMLALLASAAPALAQNGNPFDGQLPPPQPTPLPTVEPAEDPNAGFGRETLWIIGAALFVTFIGIGVWISRDARRALPPDERDDPRRRDQGPHRHERQAKAKARAKGRAQRRARRAARRTRR